MITPQQRRSGRPRGFGRSLRAAFLVLVALATAAICTPAQAASPNTDLWSIQDTRIDEASGIAAGMVSHNILYLENDSGDTNRFFALDRTTGLTAAVVTIPGATNVDWEDIAVAPDTAGTPSVWLADIGDNGADRSEVDVYRIDEPDIKTSDRNRSITASQPDVWRLRYPDGPVNAESLAVTPRGRAYIVTKSYFGSSDVYRLPLRPDPDSVQTVAKVGSIQFAATKSGGAGSLTATSAGINRAGDLFVVRTYSDAFVWKLDGYLGAALPDKPVQLALPSQPQGEGVVIQGNHLLLDSEGVHSAVWRVQLPASTAQATATSPARRTEAAVGRVSGPRADGVAVPGLPDWITNVGVAALVALVASVVAFGLAPAIQRRRRRPAAAFRSLHR